MAATLPKPHPSIGLATDPLAHLYDKRVVVPRDAGLPNTNWNKLSTRQRRITELAIKGLTPTHIRAQLEREGIPSPSLPQISGFLKSHLVAQHIEKALNKDEGVAVEQRKALDQMLEDASDVLHQAAKGVMLQPRVDEEGNVVAGSYDYVPVGARDRISAAKEILNRHPSTAPVTRNQTDVTHHGLVSPEAVMSARRELDLLMNVSTGVLNPPSDPYLGDEEAPAPDDDAAPWEDTPCY